METMDDSLELAACGLAPSVLGALLNAGFRYKSDLSDLTARDLANESGLDVDEAARILGALQPTIAPPPLRSAFDILEEERTILPIPTMIPELDVVLGGGFTRGEVTEICGVPGSGKTQLVAYACLAVQCQVQVPTAGAVFIDTEGSFVIDRVVSLAECILQSRPNLQSRGLDINKLLSGITYFRAHDFVEQVEILQSLPLLLSSRPEIQLLVVDSIAFHFRHEFEHFAERSRSLDTTAALLQQIANDYNVAVLITNHSTSRLSMQSAAKTIPALGESWSHSVSNRLTLSCEDDTQVVVVNKSSCVATGVARYSRASGS